MSNTKKLVTIGGSGAIPELGYICAPIINPCKIDIDKVSKIVCSGRKVYAVNPADQTQKVLLTPSTVYIDNFADKKVATATATAEVKTGAPKTEPVVEKHMTKAERKAAARAAAAEAAEAKVEEPKAEPIAPDASAADFFKN